MKIESVHQASDEELAFLTTTKVKVKTGLSSTSLYRRRQSDPDFPRPVVLSPGDGRRRSIRWVKHEIEEWMQLQIDSRKD